MNDLLLLGLAVGVAVYLVWIVAGTTYLCIRSSKLMKKINGDMEAGDYSIAYEKAQILAAQNENGFEEQYVAAFVALKADHFKEAMRYAKQVLLLLKKEIST